MTREIIPIISEEQWLSLREADITSTMSPALFNASPYLTIFELFHAKRSGVHVPFHQTERMNKGRKIEQYVAESVAEKLGCEYARKNNDYIRIPDERMASSFDWELVFPSGEVVNLEIKAVDHFQHKAKWEEDEAPPHIEIQVQHEMECADRYERTIIAACTGIYDFHLIERQRDREMGRNIRLAASTFWAHVDEGVAPKPDFYRDAEVIKALYPIIGEQPVDMKEDLELEALLSKFSRLKAELKSNEEEANATKAEIHLRLGATGVAYTDRFKVLTKKVGGSAGKPVTQEMVGTIIGAKMPYRQLLVTDMLSNSKGAEKL